MEAGGVMKTEANLDAPALILDIVVATEHRLRGAAAASPIRAAEAVLRPASLRQIAALVCQLSYLLNEEFHGDNHDQ